MEADDVQTERLGRTTSLETIRTRSVTGSVPHGPALPSRPAATPPTQPADGVPTRAWTGLRVTNVGPPPPHAATPPPAGGLRHRGAGLLELAARWVYGLADIELHGLAGALGAAHGPPHAGPRAWAFPHLDAPLDSLLLAALWRRLPSPDALPPRAPLALSRRPDTWADTLATRGILAGLVAEVVVDDQVAPTESPQARAARRLANATSLARLRLTAVQQRRPIVVFPEGAISDDGLVRVCRAGFRNALPPNAAFIACGTAYEVFGNERTEAIVCSEAMRLPELPGACADAVQRALLRLTPVTLTGLLGYYLLERVDDRNRPLDLAALEQWAEACLWRLNAFRGLCVHRPLRHPNEQRVRLQRATLQLRQWGYLNQNGALSARLGHAVDLASADRQPQRNRLGLAPHRLDPLAFWGNRLRQQAACWPALSRALVQTLEPAGPVADEASEPNVSGCPIV